MNGNILFGQSGGPTSVINSSLYGLISESIQNEKIDKIYGMINGIEGFLQGEYLDLRQEFCEKDHLEKLKYTPAAFLGSCRYKLADNFEDEVYLALTQKLNKLDIRYIAYIGGNDSMDTVSKLSKYFHDNNINIGIVGIPKTVDNDLMCIDHTPGFGSAAKFVATTVRQIALDVEIYRQKSVTIVEIMGRHTGWLTASSVAARRFDGDNPVLIYLPEVVFNAEKVCEDIEKCFESKNNLIICVSEGLKNDAGKFICENFDESKADDFGHKQLAGAGKVFEKLIKQKFACKVRSVELNITQRSKGTLASKTDADEAEKVGRVGVEQLTAGATGKMISFERKEGKGYNLKYTLVDVHQVCNKEKTFPQKWITNDGSYIHDDFLCYLTPLLLGETETIFTNGLPDYCYMHK